MNPSSPITIRLATLDDIPTLAAHRRKMWWDMGRRDQAALAPVEAAATEYFTEAIPTGAYRGYVVTNASGQIIAGAGIVISAWPGVFGQKQPRKAMILNMYVEHEYRRQGIARRLMQEMIAWCRENGFSCVGLHASDEGRPLYASFGFKPTNEMRLDF